MASQPTLKSLARAYATGTLEKEKYRQQRANYLEAVLAGTISVQTKPPATRGSEQNNTSDSTRQRPDRPDSSTSMDTNPLKSKPALIAGGVILLFIIIAVVLIPGGGDDAAPSQSNTTENTALAPAVTAQSTSPAQGLIRTFLNNNIWSESSMASFLDNWNTIPAAEKTNIQDTAEFSQLSSSLYKKLVEERALSTIGNPETSLGKQRQLVNFARAIGITDPRISLPR